MKLNYYARLKEDNVCIEIVSTPKDLKDVKGYVKIPDYNPTLLYRKWENNQWSSETYEPQIDAVLQEKINSLELENDNLKTNIQNLDTENQTLNSKVTELEGTIMELTTIIAGLQGGAN